MRKVKKIKCTSDKEDNMKLEGAYIRTVLRICAKDTEIRPLKVNIPYYQRPYQWGEKEIAN